MKKTELGYNGWANHATWLVALWEYIDLFSETYFENGDKPEDVSERDVEEMFYDYVDNEIPSSGIISDMISSVTSTIDWREITEHVKDQLQDRILDNF